MPRQHPDNLKLLIQMDLAARNQAALVFDSDRAHYMTISLEAVNRLPIHLQHIIIAHRTAQEAEG